MSDFYSDEAFFAAWQRAATLAGGRWFGEGGDPAAADSKWQLPPRVDDIRGGIGVLSSGEAAFLAALVSFYNADTGGELLQQAIGRQQVGLADIAAALDERRRRLLAELFVAYNGW